MAYRQCIEYRIILVSQYCCLQALVRRRKGILRIQSSLVANLIYNQLLSMLNIYAQSSQTSPFPFAIFIPPSSSGGPLATAASGSNGTVVSPLDVPLLEDLCVSADLSLLAGSAFLSLRWPSTCPRSRVGSMMLRTSCLRCFTSW